MMPEHLITSALQVKYCVLLCGDDIDPHVRQILFDDQKFLFQYPIKGGEGGLWCAGNADFREQQNL